MTFINKQAGLSRSARSWRVPGLILGLAFTLSQGYSSGQVPSNQCPQGSVPPPPGMVAWWSLDEGLGATTVSDSAGGGNDGTSIPGAIGLNGPTPVAGLFVGNSLRFGNNRYVEVPPASNLDFGTGNFTVDAWVKFTPGTQTEPIVHKLDSNGGYFLYIASSNQGIRNLVLEVGSLKFMGPQINVPIGTWIFVAATRLVPSPTDSTKQEVTLYVGASALTDEQQINSATSTAPLLIGHWPSNPHAGLTIDEVEIFNRVLQPTEIAAIFNAGNKGKCLKIGNGLTWRLNSTNTTTGTLDVGCGFSNNVNECNPYTGDTICTTQLPVLCFKPAQLSVPTNVVVSQYHQWSGGIVATTPAVAGNSASNPDLTTIAKANIYCADLFGPGWRVAEFHDGWGWYFQAYGGLGQPTMRFWVDINGQPNATCWN
jgi:hypothetical protein